jgi:hypothetical protein
MYLHVFIVKYMYYNPPKLLRGHKILGSMTSHYKNINLSQMVYYGINKPPK